MADRSNRPDGQDAPEPEPYPDGAMLHLSRDGDNGAALKRIVAAAKELRADRSEET